MSDPDKALESMISNLERTPGTTSTGGSGR